jgi:hypothetical protein
MGAMNSHSGASSLLLDFKVRKRFHFEILKTKEKVARDTDFHILLAILLPFFVIVHNRALS